MSDDKKLIDAYAKMMHSVHASCKAQADESLPTIDQAIEGARQEAINDKSLSAPEAEKIALYLRRDLHAMAQFMETDKNEQPESWLSFDWQLAEDRAWEMFLSVADKTRVELSTFKERLENPAEYAAGEITGLGTLECSACGKLVHFYKADVIPACDSCQSKNYIRVAD